MRRARAMKGRWCAEDQPTGFTHFHRTTPGHGVLATELGAWVHREA